MPEHVFDVGRAERTAVFVDQDRTDDVGDRGMAYRPPQPEVAAAHDDHATLRPLRRTPARRDRRADRGRTRRDADRRRARPRARRRIPAPRPGPCASPAGRRSSRGATLTARCSSASVGAPAPARIQSSNPGAGSCASPSTAGWSPPRSMIRASVSRASTSAAAAAITEVPEPPFGDQKHTSMAVSPRRGAPGDRTERGNRRGRKRGKTPRRKHAHVRCASPQGQGCATTRT